MEPTNETMKVTEVITKMSITKQINGYNVSAEVEVYNDTKEIKSITARFSKVGEENNMSELWTYSVGRTACEGNAANLSPSSNSEKKASILAIGIELEKSIIEMLQTNVELLK